MAFEPKTLIFPAIITLVVLFVLNLFNKSKENESEEKNEFKFDPNGPVLSPSQFRPFSILKIQQLSQNTKLFRFELPPGKSLQLPVGRHLTIKANIDGKDCLRSYTPVSHVEQIGYFDLIIKTYETGLMTPYLHQLKPGAKVLIRGPVGRFQYKINQYKNIALIGAGTGLTPCYQFMRYLLESEEMKDDVTKIVFYYQNRTFEDILLFQDLINLSKKFSDRLEIKFFLSNYSNGSSDDYIKENDKSNLIPGYISDKDIQLISPSNAEYVCICGPSGFNTTMKNKLLNVGHKDKETIYIW